MTDKKPRVILVRGHQATPWELRIWERLRDRYDVAWLASSGNEFEVGATRMESVPVRTRNDRLPGRRLGSLVSTAFGDRYRDLDAALAGAEIVHAEELSYWFADGAARAKPSGGFRLVQTVWETIPFGSTYRNPRARKARKRILAATDLFLAATERARDALLLEGVPADLIEVCPPGIDLERFASAAREAPPDHLIVSPGRLVWEKGHQDVLRAVAALRRGLVESPASPRVLIVGRGPEEKRLRGYAEELGMADAVEIRSVPYDDMPAAFASASCMVLASLPSAGCMLHPLDVPHCFWEEQFGLVLAEAMAARLPIVASTSGAIPEVAAHGASYFAPGDWMGIARALAEGPLSRGPGERVEYPAERVERFSTTAAADRLAAAYERLLAGRPS